MAFVSNESKPALGGDVVKAAGDHYCRFAWRQLLLENTRRSETCLEARMICNGAAIAGDDRDRGGYGCTGFGVNHASGEDCCAAGRGGGQNQNEGVDNESEIHRLAIAR